MHCLSQDVYDTIKVWDRLNKNAYDKARLDSLLQETEKNKHFLQTAFTGRLKFGTAGLRGKMDIGPANMNCLNVIQVSQGIVPVARQYYEKHRGELSGKALEWSVVVGFDGRKHSAEFAKYAGNVFMQHGLKVYHFGKQTVPTPLVPFSVTLTSSCFGVMITASHNPKEDNGYKLYWANGTQIVSPLDKTIEESVILNQEKSDRSWEVSEYENLTERNVKTGNDKSIVTDIYEQATCSYLDKVKLSLDFADFPLDMNTVRMTDKVEQLRITYSAMHGVGYEMIKSIFKRFNLPEVIPVEEQVWPNPDFPTVRFPNPEEGESVLDLAMRTARQNDSRVILANDPDADRVALAYWEDPEWKVFSGNEIGALLGWWLWVNWRNKNPNGDASCVHMISSTVSSSILSSMARKHGFNHHETLTGFKWMGNKAFELMTDLSSGNKAQVLFAFEEAIGFMCGTTVLDKDGISAAAVLAQMLTWLHHQHRTPSEQLDNIFTTYGLHLCKTFYYLSYKPECTVEMFNEIRHSKDGVSIKDDICYQSTCGSFPICRVRDLTKAIEVNLSTPNHPQLPTLPSSSSSEMITFYLNNGTKVTLRTSGTEPKIKCYIEIISPEYEITQKENFTKSMQGIVDSIVSQYYKPEIRGFSQ